MEMVSTCFTKEPLAKKTFNDFGELLLNTLSRTERNQITASRRILERVLQKDCKRLGKSSKINNS